ncbi:MAG TPA: HIT domain-containing protein, partial [Cytophagaceae bacterium]
NNCPFCAKSADEAFLTSKNFLAIYNIAPVLPGHSLVIPKRHVESVFDLTEEETGELMQLARKVAMLLGEELDTDAFDWAVQEKEEAGQSIPHVHMHVVPRKIGDLPKPGDWYQELEKSEVHIESTHRKKLNPEEMKVIVDRLRKAGEKLAQ